MESLNSGADHEQSHDIHASSKNVTTEFAKFVIKEVHILFSIAPIGKFGIANRRRGALGTYHELSCEGISSSNNDVILIS